MPVYPARPVELVDFGPAEDDTADELEDGAREDVVIELDEATLVRVDSVVWTALLYADEDEIEELAFEVEKAELVLDAAADVVVFDFFGWPLLRRALLVTLTEEEALDELTVTYSTTVV